MNSSVPVWPEGLDAEGTFSSLEIYSVGPGTRAFVMYLRRRVSLLRSHKSSVPRVSCFIVPLVKEGFLPPVNHKLYIFTSENHAALQRIRPIVNKSPAAYGSGSIYLKRSCFFSRRHHIRSSLIGSRRYLFAQLCPALEMRKMRLQFEATYVREVKDDCHWCLENTLGCRSFSPTMFSWNVFLITGHKNQYGTFAIYCTGRLPFGWIVAVLSGRFWTKWEK